MLLLVLVCVRSVEAQDADIDGFEAESPIEQQLATQGGAAPPNRGNVQSYQSWLQLGFDEVQKRHAENAIEAFTYALEYRPESKDALFGLGTALVQLQQYEKALNIFEPLVQNNPDDFSLINNLAWIYATAEDIQYRNADRAIELARKAMLMRPADYHVWHTLAVAYYLKGDYARALRIAEEAVALVEDKKNVLWFEVHDLKTLVDTCRKALDAKDLMPKE